MRYWIGVASREHVQWGKQGGYCQLCHGKAQPLKRMAVGDAIIYYSSKERFEAPQLCQRITALGRVVGREVYPFEMAPGFVPYRRDIDFVQAREVDIRPLIPALSFIQDKSRWGYTFRYGHLEIPQVDFELIAAAMLACEANESPYAALQRALACSPRSNEIHQVQVELF